MGYYACQLTGTRMERFDDKALQCVLARPWGERLPLVLISRHELPVDASYEVPVDLVHSLYMLDARVAMEERNEF